MRCNLLVVKIFTRAGDEWLRRIREYILSKQDYAHFLPQAVAVLPGDDTRLDAENPALQAGIYDGLFFMI